MNKVTITTMTVEGNKAKFKRKRVNSRDVVGWTSFYCPRVDCGAIVYNTNEGAKKEIKRHLKTHK